MRVEPAEPDTASRPRYISERFIEIMFSRTNHHRATVTQDSQGLFRVHRDRWYTGDCDFGNSGSWVQDDRMATITDSLESARRLAAEALTATPEGFSTPPI